jgi:hypothetical protein
MSLPHIIMWAIVLVVGVPSAWRNPTAGALVLCWVVSEGVYSLTGNGLATEFFLFPDFVVIAVIAMKPEVCNFRPYISAWHQAKCLLLERSVPDRIVLLLFPVAWYFYAADIAPYYQWWALWWISVVQYLVAGFEGFSKIYRSRVTSGTPDYPSGDVFRRLAWSPGGDG